MMIDMRKKSQKRIIKLEPEEFKQLQDSAQFDRITTNKFLKEENRVRRIKFMKELGIKYGFNPRKARFFSDGTVEIE